MNVHTPALTSYSPARTVDFETLFAERRWKPIRNCPGRFVLDDGDPGMSPASLGGSTAEVREFRVAAAKDMVVVLPFPDGGGLISYKREDETYLHTLNTPEGFARKLAQLGIVW